MSRLAKLAVVVLAVSMLSPMTAPASAGGAGLGRTTVRQPAPITRSAVQTALQGARSEATKGDVSSRLKDDSDARLAPPAERARLDDGRGVSAPALGPPRQPRPTPLVLRI